MRPRRADISEVGMGTLSSRSRAPRADNCAVHGLSALRHALRPALHVQLGPCAIHDRERELVCSPSVSQRQAPAPSPQPPAPPFLRSPNGAGVLICRHASPHVVSGLPDSAACRPPRSSPPSPASCRFHRNRSPALSPSSAREIPSRSLPATVRRQPGASTKSSCVTSATARSTSGSSTSAAARSSRVLRSRGSSTTRSAPRSTAPRPSRRSRTSTSRTSRSAVRGPR